jgi:hypothetical protein
MRRANFKLAVIAMAAFGTAPAAAQVDGAALMQEGNALYRDTLYRAALIRYQEAEAAGFASPLLDYNIGVTAYRLERFDEAAVRLERAYGDAALAALAAYNLGLTHRAAGRGGEAARWFDIAATRADDSALADAARSAQSRLAAPATTAVETARPARVERERPRVGDVNLVVRTGFGSDDNVNRAPGEPYVDFAHPDQPAVVPEVVASDFTPVEVTAEYVLFNEAGDSNFVFGYDLDSDYYSEDFANDETTQRLRMGADLRLDGRAGRQERLESNFFVTRHHQRNFDPDDGVDRGINDFDFYRQFTYTGAGISADFSHQIGRWQWGFDTHLERREYDRVPLVANYDSELYLVTPSVEYAFSDAMSIRFAAHAYRRLADERPSRDLFGVLLTTNPPLEYDYRGVELGLARQLFGWLTLDASVLQLERTDGFVGYNDYTQDLASLRAKLWPGRRFSMSLGITTRSFEYPNAFAFHDPALGLKELGDDYLDVAAEFVATRTLSIFAELSATDVTSTDTRAAYTRARSSIGVTWRPTRR